jgi:hypothetical protein
VKGGGGRRGSCRSPRARAPPASRRERRTHAPSADDPLRLRTVATDPIRPRRSALTQQPLTRRRSATEPPASRWTALLSSRRARPDAPEHCLFLGGTSTRASAHQTTGPSSKARKSRSRDVTVALVVGTGAARWSAGLEYDCVARASADRRPCGLRLITLVCRDTSRQSPPARIIARRHALPPALLALAAAHSQSHCDLHPVKLRTALGSPDGRGTPVGRVYQ